jgi:hypothetical protein
MCPFCIGAAAWAAAGIVSAGGLGVLAAVVRDDRRSVGPEVRGPARSDDDGFASPGGSGRDDRQQPSP